MLGLANSSAENLSSSTTGSVSTSTSFSSIGKISSALTSSTDIFSSFSLIVSISSVVSIFSSFSAVEGSSVATPDFSLAISAAMYSSMASFFCSYSLFSGEEALY